ncbi:MAG: superoxide dismutase family protein [Proteobacteria bacterium]|nr:superoxide dismutase family protein [Pseudomonadota bacterium]
MPRFRVSIVAATACAALAACGSTSRDAPDPTSDGIRSKSPVVEAQLKAPGNGPWEGTAKFSDRGDGVLVTLYVKNLAPGAYRFAIHAKDNCSSPNFFSAGPAWAPPGSTKPAVDIAPPLYTNGEGDITTTFRIAGVRISGPDSLEGRSVVLHQGSTVADTRPGEPNKRVLCGVVGPVTSFMN